MLHYRILMLLPLVLALLPGCQRAQPTYADPTKFSCETNPQFQPLESHPLPPGTGAPVPGSQPGYAPPAGGMQPAGPQPGHVQLNGSN